jgi:glucan-binding YG repeat protein
MLEIEGKNKMAFEKTKKRLAEAVKRARLKKAYKKEGMEKKTAKAKAEVKAKAPETGKVRRGAKGVESTKGGEYVKYAKKSKAAESFRSKFAKARKAGEKSFTWDGRSYSTARADDKKKAAPKKVAPKVTPKPTSPSPEGPSGEKEYEAKPGQKSTMYDTRPKAKEGGLVGSNPYGWPSSDSRKR